MQMTMQVGLVLLVGTSLALAMTARQSQVHNCPLGFEPVRHPSANSTGECKCKEHLDPAIHCDQDSKQLYLKVGYCMTTYNETDTESTVVVGQCPYIHPSAENSSLLRYFPLPPNLTESDLDEYMCGEINRVGRLCGQCKNGTGPLVFSAVLKCVECLDYSYGWIVYLAFQSMISTIFVVIVILFRVKIFADNMAVIVLFCQMTGAEYHYRNDVGFLWKHPWQKILSLDLYVFYSIFNFNFFQIFIFPFCISDKLKNLNLIAIDYLTALYPLLSILIIYVLVRLYDRNFKPLVIIWRPVAKMLLYLGYRKDVKLSLIDAFNSFFVLAHFRIIIASVTLLFYTNLNTLHNSAKPPVFYLDGTVPYSNNAFMILASLMCVSFTAIPTILLLVYPTKTFQKFLNSCKINFLPLHIFMDSFLGYYKNGTNGTRDYRYFAGLSLLFRYLVFTNIFIYNETNIVSCSSFSMVAMVFSLSFALCQPYKRNACNTFDSIILLLWAVGHFLVRFQLTFTKRTFTMAEGMFVLMLLHIPALYFLSQIGYYLYPKFKKVLSFATFKLIQRAWTQTHNALHPDENQALIQNCKHA